MGSSDKDSDRSFQTESNSTSLVIRLDELSGNKTYSIFIKGRTIKGYGKLSKEKVRIHTPVKG